LRTADLGGLDVFCAISDYLFADLNADKRAPSVLKDLVEQGKLGAKTGEGFYSYSEDELDRVLAQRDRVLLGFLDVLKREVGDE
jgi:3-hydroxybutyryl-CoA dehydrogenase